VESTTARAEATTEIQRQAISKSAQGAMRFDALDLKRAIISHVYFSVVYSDF
jgi:hypothetical protein